MDFKGCRSGRVSEWVGAIFSSSPPGGVSPAFMSRGVRLDGCMEYNYCSVVVVVVVGPFKGFSEGERRGSRVLCTLQAK